MCGRFAFVPKIENLEDELQIIDRDNTLNISYNISPGMEISTFDKDFKLKNLKWGLIPHWSKDKSLVNKLYNARSETAHQKPSFKNAFSNRCLIPATGFYEWKKSQTSKSPYYVKHVKNKILYFAGISDQAKIDGEIVESVTILTTNPNQIIKKIHNRMPVILDEKNIDLWLNGENDTIIDSNIFTPYSSNVIEAYRVSDLVNDASINNEKLIEKIDITLF